PWVAPPGPLPPTVPHPPTASRLLRNPDRPSESVAVGRALPHVPAWSLHPSLSSAPGPRRPGPAQVLLALHGDRLRTSRDRSAPAPGQRGRLSCSRPREIGR